MECANLYSRTKERYESLMKYYLENNDQSYCTRLTYSYVILGLIVRTFEELDDAHVSDIDGFYKFIGLVTVFLERLEVCGSQEPEAVCIGTKKCTGLWCTGAYDMYSPNKLISLLERYRAEMFSYEPDLGEMAVKVHAAH